MEHRSIASLLSESPERSFEAYVTHYEDIPDHEDFTDAPMDLVVLGLTLDAVHYTNVVEIVLPRSSGEDADAFTEKIRQFKLYLRECYDGGELAKVHIAGATGQNGHIFPVISPVETAPASGEVAL